MKGLLKCPECKCLFYTVGDAEAHYRAWHEPSGEYYRKKGVEVGWTLGR